MDKIELDLSLNEINLILQALGEMPYAKVHLLVAKIHQQAEVQLNSPVKERIDKESKQEPQ